MLDASSLDSHLTPHAASVSYDRAGITTSLAQSATRIDLSRCSVRYYFTSFNRARLFKDGEKPLVTGTTGNFGCELLESLLMDDDVDIVYAVNRRGTQAFDRQKAAFQEKNIDDDLLNSPKFKLVEGDLKLPGLGVEQSVYNEVRS